MIASARHPSFKKVLYTSALSIFAVGTVSSALMVPGTARAQMLPLPPCTQDVTPAGSTTTTWTCLIPAESGTVRIVSGIPGDSTSPDTSYLSNVTSITATHGAVQIGRLDAATAVPGSASVSVGNQALAEGNNGVAIGNSTEASGNQGVALGNLAHANSVNQVSVGPEAGHQSNDYGVSIGDMANSGTTPAGEIFQHNVAVGAKSRYSAVGNRNTAVGNYSGNNTTGSDNTSLGFYSLQAANGDYNTALGTEAGFHYQGDYSSMVGMLAGRDAQGEMNAFFGSFAGQGVSGDGNTMIGAGSANYNYGTPTELGTALGLNARTSSYGTAIGAESMVATEGGIALGAASVMDQTLATASYVPVTNDASLPDLIGATAATQAGVSIGNTGTGTYRQIHNLAAGTLDTDAVNVAQLRTLDRALEAQIVRIDNLSQSAGSSLGAVRYAWNDANNDSIVDASEIDYTQVMVGNGTATAILRQVSAGNITATSTDGVNGGQIFANQQGVANILGGSAYGVNVNTDGTLSAPAYAISAITASGATSVTHNNVGDALAGLNSSLLNVNGRLTALEQTPPGGGTGGSVDALNWNASAGAYDATRGGQVQAITGVAAGTISETSTDAVNGSQLHATNQRVTTLETRVDTIDDRLADVEGAASNAVTYATNAQGTRLNRVDLLGGDPNAPVVISNLAAGVADTDAVNVGQFKAGLADTLAAANTYADQVGQRTLQQANAYTDTMISNLNNSISDVRSEARQAAAIGLAAASLRFADTPGATTVAVGGGGWQGEGAVAVGIGYTTRDNRFRSNATLTSAGGEVGIGGGLSWTFGAR